MSGYDDWVKGIDYKKLKMARTHPNQTKLSDYDE